MSELAPHQIGIVREIINDVETTLRINRASTDEVVLKIIKDQLHHENNYLFWDAIPRGVDAASFGEHGQYVVLRPNQPDLTPSELTVWDKKDIQIHLNALSQSKRGRF